MSAISRPDVRAVLSDAAEESGLAVRWGWLLRYAQRLASDYDAADADAAADTDDADTDAADTDDDDDDDDDDAADTDDDDDDAAADTDADDDAAAVDYAAVDYAAVDYADTDDDDDDDADVHKHNHYWRGDEMEHGIVMVKLPGRYWSVTRVGWAKRLGGDEWALIGATTVVRTSGARRLSDLAVNGPGSDHRCDPPARLPELLHRFTPRRVLVVDERAWAQACPRPAGWEDEP